MKGWLIFTGFMSFASVLCLAAYIACEINGVHMGKWNWLMMISGAAMWIWMFTDTLKKSRNGKQD